MADCIVPDSPLSLELLSRAVQFVELLVDSISPLGKVSKSGGKRVPEIVANTVESAMEIFRQQHISGFHVLGSCAMIPRDEGGVGGR